ncbi:hypothetical protein C8R47DRAFT_1219043 [Mycena vitilis]|nr:hypothetical protein C8R47DRAFT_1219043 [Mycena vitilis]
MVEGVGRGTGRMGVSFIPQELVNSIIHELHDIPSLKACALAGQMFRDPSQRVLLQSLTLTSWTAVTGSFRAAYTLLMEAPHLRAYIKCLKIRLRLPLTNLSDMQRVLDLLGTVHRLTIDGDLLSSRWSDIRTPHLSQIFVDFLERQPLQYLYLHRIARLPCSVFARAAPFISFEHVSLNDFEVPSLDVRVPIVEDLILQNGTQNIHSFFAHPHLQPQLGILRRLSINPRYDGASALLIACGNTIEHLHWNYDGPELLTNIPLPPLPVLRSLEIFIAFPAQRISYLLDTTTAILASGTSPMLNEVVFAFASARADYQLPPPPLEHALNALSTALAKHPASPSICWRTSFTLPAPGDHFAQLATHLKRYMPHVQAAGKMLVEKYQPAESIGNDWASRHA